MPQDGLIECVNCHNVGDFVQQDGNFFCGNCGTESQEHGMQTVVEDETLGVYDSATASGLRKQVVGKKKRAKNARSKERIRYLKSFKHKFTSIDAFTYILKQWTEEAIILGVDEELRTNVSQLWCRYLQKSKLAFVDKSKKRRTLGLRDLQVAIAGRERLLNHYSVADDPGKRRRRTVDSESEFSTDDDSIQAKRVRNKKRRSFLKSVISDNESENPGTDDIVSDSSFYYESESDTFSLSLSSAGPPSSAGRSDTSGTDTFLSSNSGGRASGGEESVGSNEDAKIIKRHANIFKGLKTCSKTSAKRKYRRADIRPWVIRLKMTFSLFALAVMTTKNNWITLADLLYWAKNDALTWFSCIIAVPKELKMSTLQDHITFSGFKQPFMDHRTIRRNMYDMGSWLNLKCVNLSAGDGSHILKVLARYIRELSLPRKLLDIAQNLLPANLITEGFSFSFDRPSAVSVSSNGKIIPSTDDYCMGIILFVLKYLYVLDDVTNREIVGSQQEFNVNDWIKLSKLRCGLAVRYCYNLHDQLRNLAPNVQKSPAQMLRHLQETSDKIQTIRSHMRHVPSDENEDGTEKAEFEGLPSEQRIKKVEKLCSMLKKSLDLHSPNLVTHQLNLGYSDTPLHDFARFHLELSKEKEFMPYEERIPEIFLPDMESLLDSYNADVNFIDMENFLKNRSARLSDGSCKRRHHFCQFPQCQVRLALIVCMTYILTV